MKNLILALTLTASSLAFADQATDSISGPVTCKGNGFSVTISTDRNTLTIRKDGAKPEVYHGLDQNAGDVETWYTPKGAKAPMLGFSDQGDYLIFNSTRDGVDISCPQGDN